MNNGQSSDEFELKFSGSSELELWDIPCIARVMVKITLSGGVSIVSQQAGWNIPS